MKPTPKVQIQILETKMVDSMVMMCVGRER